jgi:hypothetical protein
VRHAAAAGLLALAALTACSDDSPDRAAPTTLATGPAPTTAPPSTSPSTTVPATTTSAPRATTTAVAASPEGRARALYAAWMAGDRAAAANAAQPAAVTALFARPWQAGDGWTFAECSGAAGSVICTWRRPAGQEVLFRVQNATGGAPVTVAEVRFDP